jgi:geranylgeranyl diphosphate synthase type II
LCIAAAWASTGTVNSVCHDYAVSLELLHCASLVHDDLPCFDDAGQRRGRLTVHRAFGEASAVLVGDSLVIAAFEQLGRVAALSPVTAGELVALLAQAAGVPRGLTAGQAWEEEPTVALSQYHDAKTAALFEAALVGGARAAGARGEPWRPLGRLLGRAYQLADDLLDATSWGGGKTSGRDAELERPSAVRVLGLDQTKVRLQQAVDQIFSVVPPCQGEHEFRLFLAEIVDALGVVLPAA